jgi:hypothetical protein
MLFGAVDHFRRPVRFRPLQRKLARCIGRALGKVPGFERWDQQCEKSRL